MLMEYEVHIISTREGKKIREVLLVECEVQIIRKREGKKSKSC